jgi:hypothetical protein
MNSLNDVQPQQQQHQQQNDKLFNELNKKFNIFNTNSEQRQTQSPTTSMRSTSSNYANGIHKSKQTKSNDQDNDIEEGQQIDDDQQPNNHDSENEDEDQMESSANDAMLANQTAFNALLNYNKLMNGNGELSLPGNLPLIGAGNPASAAANADFGSCNMQPFLFECQDETFNSNFVPCMVYLPVKNKLGSSITLKVTLKPLDSNATESSAENNARVGTSEENEDLEENSD